MSINKYVFCCSICDSTECCERTDLHSEPVLCDICYYFIVNLQKSLGFRKENKNDGRTINH